MKKYMKRFLIFVLILILSIFIFYPKNKNIIYIPNFLSSRDFEEVKNNLKNNDTGFKNESFRKVKPLRNDDERDKNIYKNILFVEIYI